MEVAQSPFSSLPFFRAGAIFQSVKTVEVFEAQSRLAELIENLVPGEDVIIALHQKPVARLSVDQLPRKAKRQFGSAKGKVIFHSGWDEPCDDFAPYTK